MTTTAVFAQQTSWTGQKNTQWHNGGNWTNGVPLATSDVIIGDEHYIGRNEPIISTTVSCRSLSLGQGSVEVSLTITSNDNLTVQGDVNIGLLGTINHQASTITLTGNWTNKGNYVPQYYSSTVAFAGTVQSIEEKNSFATLKINAGSTTLLNSSFAIHTQLSVSGILDPQLHLVSAANIDANVVVNNYGLLKVRALTLQENYNTSVLVAPLSTIEYASGDLDQTIAPGPYGTLKISGNTVKTLGGNSVLQSSAANVGNIIVVSGTLNLADKTLNRGTGGGGELLVANGATLRIGGTNTMPAQYASYSLGNTSIVKYDGYNQSVSPQTYGHLVLSAEGGSVTKTMPAQPFIVYGNFSSTKGSGTALNFTAGGNISIYGNVQIGEATTFNAASYTHTIGGNWLNEGSLIGSSSTIRLNGTGKLISGGGSHQFHDLLLSGQGIQTNVSSLQLSGNLATIQAGSFTHTGLGICIMSGSGKSISGSDIFFQHLSVTGSITTEASFEVAGNLSVEGSFTATQGTVTMTGQAGTISSTGTLSLANLNARGQITTVSSFSIAHNLLVQGSLTATAGTLYFTGNSSISGNPDLYHVQVSGSRLLLTAGSRLGVAGMLISDPAIFDAVSAAPTTVHYNGNGPQQITPLTYHHLSLSAAGTKTAVQDFTVRGDFSIQAGAQFDAGLSAPSCWGNWVNQGDFKASGSNIQFVGSNSSKIYGQNTFHQLTINKEAANQYMQLEGPASAATVAMRSGRLLTANHALTITSTRVGPGIILGTIVRTHAFNTGEAYAFESPYNTVAFSAVAGVTSVVVKVEDKSIDDFPNGGAINRQYTLEIAQGTYAATLRLHYEQYSLNGSMESDLQLWQNNGSNWTISGERGRDETNNWVENSILTNLNGRWTLSEGLSPFVWKGSQSSAWEEAANWQVPVGSAAQLPGASDVVEIGLETFGYQPVIASHVRLKSLHLGSSKAVDLVLNSGSLSMAGNFAAHWQGDAVHALTIGSNQLLVGGDLVLGYGTANRHINLSADSGIIAVEGSLQQAGNAAVILAGESQLSLGENYLYQGGIFSAGNSTVRYNGSSRQQLAGLNYYNLIIDKPSGSAWLETESTIAADLTLAQAGALWVQAPLHVNGHVNIGAGATLNSGQVDIYVQGNWTRQGSFNASNGTVHFNGAGHQYVNNQTFNHLRVNKSGGRLITTGHIIVNGNLQLVRGSLDLQTYQMDRSAPGGELSLADSAMLQLAGADNFPKNFATLNLHANSQVHYSGTSAQQIAPARYGHLLLSNGAETGKHLAGRTHIMGNLHVGSTAVLQAHSYTLILHGDLTNEGSFVPSTSTVMLTGTQNSMAGNAISFYNFNISGNYGVAANMPVHVYNDTELAGVFSLGNNLLVCDGNVYISGVCYSDGITTLSGNREQLIRLEGSLVSPALTHVMNFIGSVAPVLNSNNEPAFANVNIYNLAVIQTSINWNIYKDFYIAPGATFNGSTFTHSFRGAFNNEGSASSSGTFVFSPLNLQSSPVAVSLGNDTAFSSSGTLLFEGSRQIVLSGAPAQLHHLIVDNKHAEGIVLPANWTITGDLSIGTEATMHAGPHAHTIFGNINNQGVFDGQTSTVTLSSGMSHIGGNGSTQFHHLQVQDTVIVEQNITLTGNLTLNHLFDANNGEVTFTGNTNSYISGTYSPVQMKVLGSTKAGQATTTLGVDIHNLSAVHVNAGLLNAESFYLYKNEVETTTYLSVSNGASLQLGGSNTLPFFDTYLLDTASTVIYAGGQQAVYATAYGDLILRNAGTKTFDTGETSIARNLLVENGAMADALRNSSLLHYNGASGQLLPAIDHFDLQLSNTGTKVFGTGTTGVFRQFISEPGAKPDTRTNQSVVYYNGNASQIIAPLQYYTLRLGNAGNKQFSEGITGIGASLQLSEAASADARTYAASIHYNGADQLLYPMPYHHLALAGSGTKVFDAGTTHIAGTLNIAATVATDALTRSSILHFDGAGSQTIPAMDYYSLQSSVGIARSLGTDGTIRIKGSFDPGAAEYTTAGSRVEFNGSQPQNIPVLPYHSLIINNTSGATAQGNINIAEALTFMAGNLYTGSHTLHLAADARLDNERNTHYVLGHVQLAQSIGTGASNFGNMGLAIAAGLDDLGTVTVKRTTGTAIIKNGEAGISRIWDISAGGIQPVSGRDLTFSWLQADDNANNLENLQVWRSKNHLGDDWERVGALQAATYNQDGLRSVSVNTDHFSLWTARSDDFSTLPVEILYFKGQRIGQQQVKLHWTTAKEDNNYGFEVERSEDGRSFIKIGFVPGMGTTIHRQTYTFSDWAAAQGAYYRFKQLDYNGVAEYSNVIYLPYLQEEVLKAYPNPARHYITLSGGPSIAQDGAVLEASLFSVQGIEVVRCSGSLSSINGQINESMPDLSAGIYYLTIRSGDRQAMVKVVIQ